MKDFDMRIWDKQHKRMLYWNDDFAYVSHRMVVILLNGGMLMPPDHEMMFTLDGECLIVGNKYESLN
jgi:hypothetical protein